MLVTKTLVCSEEKWTKDPFHICPSQQSGISVHYTYEIQTQDTEAYQETSDFSASSIHQLKCNISL
jgi:hypothetical protein